MKAWHFLRQDKKLGYKDGREVKLGETLEVKGEISLCNKGLHASERILDALSFVSWDNAVCCLVELNGKIEKGDDKVVASERTVIKWINVDKILHEFACRVAEDVLPIFEKVYPNDNNPRKAIEAKRQWLNCELSLIELESARSAAESAAWSAAESAAWSAAESARSARSAAETARSARSARSAAESAAESAAWSAAETARSARSAAESARSAAESARSAAESAAHEKYNKWLEEMVLEAMEKEDER